MTRQSRRQFIQKTLAAAATVTVAGTKSSGQVVGANEAIRVAVAGINGRGGAHVGAFLGIPNVRITHLVDVSEYKRRQNPPGPRITPKAFGKDRRMPITNAYRG